MIVEYSEKADGRFQIYNDADIPLTVVLEPHSFTGNVRVFMLSEKGHEALQAYDGEKIEEEDE